MFYTYSLFQCTLDCPILPLPDPWSFESCLYLIEKALLSLMVNSLVTSLDILFGWNWIFTQGIVFFNHYLVNFS